MSAWLVSKTHIDALVQAGIDAEMIRHEEADELGRELWLENHKSLAYRYGDPIPEIVYTYEPLDGGPGVTLSTPSAVYWTAACYGYQTCEHPEWETSWAYKFIDALERLTEAKKVRPAVWGTNDRDAFTKELEAAA